MDMPSEQEEGKRYIHRPIIAVKLNSTGLILAIQIPMSPRCVMYRLPFSPEKKWPSLDGLARGKQH